MKILAISLQNVRRFVDPVQIGGFGSGLNVLAAPNEHGKSTFFDALHAVFFVSHRSFDKVIKTLAPNVGGDPQVTVEFEADGANWKLEKCWSSAASRKDAKLWRDGNLVAQKSEAEDVLSGLLKPPSDGGPAGLLWVRQGVVDLESGGDEQKARRDIMTSVAGEVEAMTGGRRMETALAKCAEFLGQHLTATGKSAQNGGLKKCEVEVQGLHLRRDELAEDVRKLQGDLDRRRQVRRELEMLEAPEAHEEQHQALERAVSGLRDAEEHDRKVQSGQDKLGRLEAQAEKADAKMAGLRNALREAEQAEEKASDTGKTVSQARGQRDKAQSLLDAAQTGFDEAVHLEEASAANLRLAHRVDRERSASKQRKTLGNRIETAEGLIKTLEKQEKALAAEVSTAVLQTLETLASDLSVATRSRDSAAASFAITYDDKSGGKVRRDGQVVQDGQRHVVTGQVHLDLDGIGRLEMSPPSDVDDRLVREAETALAKALAAAGVETLAAARGSHERFLKAEADLRVTQADLRAVAPGGIGALRDEYAELPPPVEVSGDVPDLQEAEQAETEARKKREAGSVALEAARTKAQALREVLTRAEALAETAQERLTRAKATLAGYDNPAALLQAMETDAKGLVQEIAAARTVFEALKGNAPDLAAARAAEKRARSVVVSVEEKANALREERAGLDSRIAVVSSAAVEEELALVEEQLTDAQERLDRIRFDIAVYQRLDRALRAARDSARENYVAAVHKELVPLLRMIWPDAEPVIDAETGLITAITRRGKQEDFGVLSGGTQEQISLLVRLAFARILATDGRPAPVILDDAIVYTDDDRIEQMFNALTRQAEDLQIIVFSCRQRAFLGLGGTTLSISRDEDAA
ncbi:AAA family ATPase [Shimia thalassica]|uniref:AAA family ATPase n=1 Tax=Shimia thalassica TaxID=1715693 RepID=UPI0026E3D54B|nr:chromosome segregation protein SMC [Shimia thalassica]MDO6481655.1 chromosome segregation protein SMC [Shimia thalassica]